MKRTYAFYQLIPCALLLLLLAGCATRLANSVKLHNHISIDGVDVSAKTAGEARALLAENAAERLDAAEVTLILPDEAVTLPAGDLGISLDTEAALLEASRLTRNGGTRVLKSRFTADENALREAAARFAGLYSRGAVSASVAIHQHAAMPVVYQAEQRGVAIDADALYRRLRAAVEEQSFARVEVPYTAIEPDVTLAAIQERQSLIAQFSTTFEGAPHNDADRVFNIKKAAALINGTVLQPGEEFDCNAALGDRNAENGWREAPGIRNGRYEDEYGGGVCQVSSTLFNAVMMADLSVTERQPHSWPMAYVDIGRDATISTGGKNFRFLNSGGAPLYIFMHVDDELESLTVSLYGEPLEDGQYIVVSSEKTGTLESAGEEIMLDESLPYNTKLVMREPRDGKTAVTYKEYYSRDGQLLDRVIAYEDTYRAIDGLSYVSTDLFYTQ